MPDRGPLFEPAAAPRQAGYCIQQADSEQAATAVRSISLPPGGKDVQCAVPVKTGLAAATDEKRRADDLSRNTTSADRRATD